MLDVSDNELEGVEASRTLGNLLRRNRGLERLDVDHNNWSGPTGMRAFSKGLARNHFVDTLELSRCRLGDHALSILAVHGLRHNSHLEVLALNANMVTATGVEVLVDAMEETRSVHSLFLNDNMLCDEGGKFPGFKNTLVKNVRRCPLLCLLLALSTSYFLDKSCIACAIIDQCIIPFENTFCQQQSLGRRGCARFGGNTGEEPGAGISEFGRQHLR